MYMSFPQRFCQMEPGFHPGRSIKEKLRSKNAGLEEQILWDGWKECSPGSWIYGER